MATRRPRKAVSSPGGHPPIYTGKGTHGTGLGYHGKPRGATKPAKGLGYHGKPPAFVSSGRRSATSPPTTTHPGATTPKIRTVKSPGGHPPQFKPPKRRTRRPR